LYALLGIGIEADVAGIGIPEFHISVQYRGAFRYRAGSPYFDTGMVMASKFLFLKIKIKILFFKIYSRRKEINISVRYRAGSPYFDTGMVMASTFLFIKVLD
jgi:hypothetical protein